MTTASASAAPPPGAWVWSDVDPAANFAADYAEARAKFLAASRALALPVESHVHPSARGPAGENLAFDVAMLGDPASPSLLLVTSGTQDAEVCCGRGCPVALLSDPWFVDAATLARTRACFGADVTSIYDGSSTSASVTGLLFRAIPECCPGPEYAALAALRGGAR